MNEQTLVAGRRTALNPTRIWTAADGVSFRIEAPRFAPVELHRGPGGPGRTVVHLLDGAVLRCVPGQEFALLRPTRQGETGSLGGT